MTGIIQGYAWGSTTVLPEFLGVAPDGRPQAELWLGAHPSAPARVGDRTLPDLVAADPAGVIGAASVDRFGPRLPYLLKVLAADQPLSLQAHPNRSQAEAGFARERAAAVPADRRVYADDWPKPEMMVALTPAEALCGFRDPRETYALFAALGVERATALVEPLRTGGAAELAEVFVRALRMEREDRAVVAEVVEAARLGHGDPEFGSTATVLDRYFPGDPGIIAALLLNRIRLAPGDALYLPAGNMHAYLGGSGIEIMANSDNTLRGGLTGKLVAVDELREILDFTPGEPPLVTPVPEAPGIWRYPTPAPEFRLWRLEPTTPVELPGAGAGRILLVIDGRLTVHCGERELVLNRGEAVFCLPSDQITVSGGGCAMLAGPGV